MKEILNLQEVSDYLGTDKDKISDLVSQNKIPCLMKHGILCFDRVAIERWMKEPEGDKPLPPNYGCYDFTYKGTSLKTRKLSASQVIGGEKQWAEILFFLQQSHSIAREQNRDFLYRQDFIFKHVNDYLRVSWQLGLISKKTVEARTKHYRLTQFGLKIANTPSVDICRESIRESILDMVTHNLEYDQHDGDRHAILLLWLYLSLKAQGISPEVEHFRVDRDKEKTAYPMIRLHCAEGLSRFLFNKTVEDERSFFEQWKTRLHSHV